MAPYRRINLLHCISKRIISQERIRHQDLTEYSIYFACKVGITSSYYSNINLLLQGRHQRWDGIRITGVDSGRILRFFSDPDPDPESKICDKPDSDPESLFHIGSSRSLCGHFLAKTWVNYVWIDGCSRSLDRSRILNFAE